MLITRQSTWSGKVRTLDIPVTYDQLYEWERGTLIQNAMPNLTADQREFLMTGITAEEWGEMFERDEKMPKFKITYGIHNVQEESDIIEAETLEVAKEIAYEAAMEIVSSCLSHSAEPVEDEKS